MARGQYKLEDELMARAKVWAALPAADRRRLAIRGAQSHDQHLLWSLTEAYVVLHGRSGKRVSPNTLSSYRRGVETLIDHWAGLSLLQPPSDAGQSYLDDLIGEGLRPGSIKTRLAAASRLYQALCWSGATEVAPFVGMQKPVLGEDSGDAYSDAELRDLLEVASSMEQALLLLSAHGGLRASELVAIRWADVDLGKAALRVRAQRSRPSRSVMLSSSLGGALAEHLEVAQTEPNRVRNTHVLAFGDVSTARYHLKTLCDRAWGHDYVRLPHGRRSKLPRNYMPVRSLRAHCRRKLYRATHDRQMVAFHLGDARKGALPKLTREERARLASEVRSW